MMRLLGRLLLGASLSLSWAGPLCAMPAPEPSHACCPDGAPPDSPAKDMDAACCRAAEAVPAPAVAAPAPLLTLQPAQAPVLAALPARFAGVSRRRLARAPDAPPGPSSGLSPPASGL